MEMTLKLLLPLTVALLLCIRTATALKCERCVGYDPSCSKTKQISCGSTQTMCYAHITLKTEKYGRLTKEIAKGCAGAEMCPKAGSQVLSTTTVNSKIRGRIDCCDCDNCNKGIPTIPPEKPGTLKCSNCDPMDCVKVRSINCNSLETHCYREKDLKCTAKSSPETGFGCATKQFCKAFSMGNEIHCFDKNPVVHCEVCTDSCSGTNPKVVSVPLPPGMMCFTALTEETIGGCTSFRTVRGIAGDSLCKKSQYSYNSGNTHTKIKCCDTDDCNREDPLMEMFDYEPIEMSDDLLFALQKLDQGFLFLPSTAAFPPEDDLLDIDHPEEKLPSIDLPEGDATNVD